MDNPHMPGKQYVAVLAFSTNITGEQTVALITKARPLWMKGKLNGIGGKISPGEEADAAAYREFFEEAGVWLTHLRRFCIHAVPGDGVIHWYRGDYGGPLYTKTDEPVARYRVSDILDDSGPPALPNLKWLIPLALAKCLDICMISERPM